MIKIGTALYANKSSKESVEITASNIGKVGVPGLATSKYRAGIMGSPKISSIGTLFDLIYRYPGTIAAYESTVEEAVYVEIGEDKMYVKKNEIQFEGNGFSGASKYLLVPHVIFELSSYGLNTEIKDCFCEMTGQYPGSGNISEELMFLFCDSYYYGCAKGIDTLDDETAIDEAQIQAAFRSGSFKPHALLSAIPNASMLLKKSAFEAPAKATSKKSAKKGKTVDFLAECKEGKYVIPYTWPEEMKKYIINRSFLDSFEATPEFEEIVKKIKFRSARILERMDMGLTGAEAIGKDALNILLLGKPGTGKTTLAHALSAALGMPVCTTAWNKHSDECESEGKTKIIDGKPAFVETDALIFHENGGIDVNEEINLADPSVTMGSLGQKLEYPYIVKKNGYETIVRHPLNVVIATMNVGTNGSNPLNQALANRFKTPYILDDPTRDTFVNILMKASGKDREVCEWVYSAYEATVQYLKDPDVNEEEICQNLSIRTCLGAIENMDEGQSPRRALINSIVGAVAIVDLEVARNLQHERIESLPNPSFGDTAA